MTGKVGVLVKRREDQDREVRKNMRGGSGEVKIRHYLKGEDLRIPCRLFAELRIPPGSSIGPHEHVGEEEIFLVHSGKGVMSYDGNEVELEAGDAAVTGGGAMHALRNCGSTELVVTAVIIRSTP